MIRLVTSFAAATLLPVWCRHEGAVGIGGIVECRVRVEAEGEQALGKEEPGVYVTVRNRENPTLRGAVLNGPFVLYVDCVPCGYDSQKRFHEGSTAEVVCYPRLQPGGAETFRLVRNANLRRGSGYEWTLTVVSEMIARSGQTAYSIVVADTAAASRGKGEVVAASWVHTTVQDTEELWATPAPDPGLPVHLVYLTHGILANLTADMFNVKRAVERWAQESHDPLTRNVVVRGYTGNAGRTEQGVRRLGLRNTEHLVSLMDSLKVGKLSMVGHSLGGLVQTFTLQRMQRHFPQYLARVQLGSFVVMASPMLGILGDLARFYTVFLELGVLGKSGKDLSLAHQWFRPPGKGPRLPVREKPLLEKLPAGLWLDRFEQRVLYANVAHDGIVPLRTAAMLYLDWHALATSKGIQTEEGERKSVSLPEVPERPSQVMEVEETKPQVHFRTRKQRKQQNYERILVGGSSSRGPLSIPATASSFRSTWNILVNPTPPRAYLLDPAAREPTIVHDRVYTPDQIPFVRLHRLRLARTLSARKVHRQVRIANAYQQTVAWHKVLVLLEPDAHNGIIVRRRLVNAYGWAVLEHLGETMFGAGSSASGNSLETA